MDGNSYLNYLLYLGLGLTTLHSRASIEDAKKSPAPALPPAGKLDELDELECKFAKHTVTISGIYYGHATVDDPQRRLYKVPLQVVRHADSVDFLYRTLYYMENYEFDLRARELTLTEMFLMEDSFPQIVTSKAPCSVQWKKAKESLTSADK